MKYFFVRYPRKKKLLRKGTRRKQMIADAVIVNDGCRLRLRRGLHRTRPKNFRYRERKEIVYTGPLHKLL